MRLVQRTPSGEDIFLPLRVSFEAECEDDPSASPLNTAPKSRNFENWCDFRGISRTRGYQLLKNGCGPQTIMVGRLRIVTAEADAEWVDRMERGDGAR
jgi:hypothetical protein